MAMARRSLPFFLISTVNIFLFRIDHVMLARMVGSEAVGLYSAAYTVFEVIVSLFPMLVMSAAFPVLSRLYEEDQNAFENLYQLLLKYFVYLSLPLGTGLFFLGKYVALLLYGEAFAPAGTTLAILGVAVWVFFLSTLMSWVLTAANRQRLVLYGNLTALVTNVALNLYLIPAYEANGAAVATVVSELVNLSIMAAAVSRFTPLSKLPPRFYAEVTVSLGAMAAVIWTVVSYFAHIGVFLLTTSVTVVGALVYIGITSALGTASWSELQLLRRS